MEKWGTHFVHCSDEFFVLAERDIPEEDAYDGYLQLENGVGMLRLLMDETKAALKQITDEYPEEDEVYRKKDSMMIATGKIAYPYVRYCVDEVKKVFPDIDVKILPVENHFFGEQITVSGLITGRDLIEQCKKVRNPGTRLLIPSNMLRSGETVFLDDVSVEEVQSTLQVPVVSVQSSGYELVTEITGILCEEMPEERFRPYELGDSFGYDDAEFADETSVIETDVFSGSETE